MIEGDAVGGVTTIKMDEGMDTGDILGVRELPIRSDETAESLFLRLAPIGAELLLETIEDIRRNDLRPRKQDSSAATHARLLTKNDGRIVWTDSARKIDQLVRGVYPWPGAYTTAGGKLLKVHRVRCTASTRAGEPGKILARDAEGIHVQSGDGTVILLEVQPEGGKKMTGAEFARGRGASLDKLGDAA